MFCTTKEMNLHAETSHGKDDEKVEKIESCKEIDQTELKRDSKTCPICHKMFADSSNMRRHIKTEHEKTDRFPCDQCSKSLSCKASLDYHVLTRHTEPTVLRCEQCNASFDSPANFSKHKKSHRTIHTDCPHCEKTFNTRSNLNRHKQEVHNFETRLNVSKIKVSSFSFHCDKCSYIAKRRFHLTRHTITKYCGESGSKATSSDEERRTCPVCFKFFWNSTKARRHIKSIHEITGRFRCEVCEETFTSKMALKHHSKSHIAHLLGEVDEVDEGGQQVPGVISAESKEKTSSSSHLPCFYCEKSISKQHMWRHLEEVHNKTKINTDMIHVSAYPHNCDQCTFRTKRKFDLKRHVMQKHSLCKMTFPCEICGKEYRYKASLDRHVKSHQDTM